MIDQPELTPHSYLYQRAKQIQDEILPHIESGIRKLESERLVYQTEFKVLEAAAAALPADTLPVSELGLPVDDGDHTAGAEGGVV